jgi:hypothetical protein
VENWLVCLMLTAIYGKSMHSSQTHKLFTDPADSPLIVQLELGTRYTNNGVEHVVSENPFETRLRILGSRMSWINESNQRPSKKDLRLLTEGPPLDEKARPVSVEPERYSHATLDDRRVLMERISRQLLKASQPNDLEPTYAMAADGTAIDSFGQFRRGGIDPDAAPGHRTAKLGEKPWHFGNSYLTFSRVPNIKSRNARPEPRLIEHVVVRPANLKGGVGNPILPFIQEAAAKGELKELSLDAAWFNTKAEEFAYLVQEAGVILSMAPKTSMRRVTPYEGVPLYYRHALCPGIPDEILDIARNLKRPPSLTLESGYSEEELEALAKSYGEDGGDIVDDSIFSLDEFALGDSENETDEGTDVNGEDVETCGDTVTIEALTSSAAPTHSVGPDPLTLKSNDWRDYLKPLTTLERKELIKAKRFKAYRETMNWVLSSDRIEEWALVHKEKAAPSNGYTDRFECPAKSGRLRCAFYKPSMDIDPNDRPLVENPPTGMVFCTKTMPADARHKKLDNEEKDGQAQMVRQLTFTLPRHVLPKLNTTYFTGTVDWIRDMQRRSSIEGIFGNLKSRSGGAMDKGWIGVGGQVQHALLGTIKMVALNYQNSQAWMRNHGGRTADPVYAPAPTFHGLDEITAERAEEIRRVFSSRAISSEAA